MPVRLLPVLIALVMAAGGSAIPAAAQTPASGFSMTAAAQASGGLIPGEALSVSVTATNRSTAPIVGAVATVYLDTARITSRAGLISWLTPPEGSPPTETGTNIFSQPMPTLAPGETREVSLTVPSTAIGLDSQPWGVHRLSVHVATADANLGEARSSLVWFPEASVTKTGITIVVPITLPPETVGLVDANTLAAYTSPGGVLDRQLEQLIGHRVTIAIDPRILASIRILGTTAPESAVEWLNKLHDAGNETFALAYGDSDIAATAQAGAAAPPAPTGFTIDPSRFAPAPATPTPSATPTQTATPAPTPTPTTPPVPTLPTSAELLAWDYSLPNIAWPADDTVTAPDLDAFGSAGLKMTILDSGNVSYGESGYTPGAAATIDKHSVVVADNRLSSLLRRAVVATSDTEWQAAMAELSSALALVDAESVSTPRTVLATLGRDAPPFGYRLDQTLTAVQELPWANTTSLATAITSASVGATLVPKPESAERIQLVQEMLKSDAAIGEFSSVLSDPTLETGPRRLSMLALLSNAWNDDQTGWVTAVNEHLTANQKALNSVMIAQGSTINLVADNGNLPITVSNGLAHAVTVYVTVRPERAILTVLDNRVKLTIEANSQARAFIPVRSVANGPVTADVSLASASGVPISVPALVEVNVLAGWETVFIVVIAVLLLGVFGFGVWRNIAKRRKARKSDEAAADPVAEPAAMEPHTGTGPDSKKPDD